MTGVDEVLQPMPSLTDAEFDTLRTSIATFGQMNAVEVDAVTGDVLDGHHRLRACQEIGRAPLVKKVHGLQTREQRVAYAIRRNLGDRRHLTQEQRDAVLAAAAEAAAEMRSQTDPSTGRTYTQETIAAAFGVSQQTVSNWLARCVTTPGKAPEVDDDEVLRLYEAIGSQDKVAEKLGVPRDRVRKSLARSGRATASHAARDGSKQNEESIPPAAKPPRSKPERLGFDQTRAVERFIRDLVASAHVVETLQQLRPATRIPDELRDLLDEAVETLSRFRKEVRDHDRR